MKVVSIFKMCDCQRVWLFDALGLQVRRRCEVALLQELFDVQEVDERGHRLHDVREDQARVP